MRTAVPNKLRPELWHWNEHLCNAANHLWKVSEEIHNRQNQKGDPNEYGRVHVESVEHNIWRLFFDPQNPAEFVEKNTKDAKARPYEIFLLSASACCHDFDKAVKLPEGVPHGKQSVEIVRELKDYLRLNDSQVEDIGAVISIHGIEDANEFKDALREIPTERDYEYGTFNPQRLALLLKASDILHLGHSRISESMTRIIDWNHVDKSIKQKFTLRSNTCGWDIRSKVIHIEARVKNKDINEVKRCFDWVRKNEWSAVREHLQIYGFPYNLEIGFGVPSGFLLPEAGIRYMYIPMKAKRYISGKHARIFLCTALKEDTQYSPPICRNGYATHAAGVAIARISLLALDKKMKSFKINFNTKVNELILETECILSKLSEHFIGLSNAKRLFKQLVQDDALSGDFETPLKDAILALPTGKSFYDHLSRFLREFESNLEDMRKRLTPRIYEIIYSNMTETEQREALESAKWLTKKDPDIKNWFLQKKKRLSDLILGHLEKALLSLHSMLTPIQDDWDKDYSWIQRQEKGMHKVPSSFESQKNA